MVFSKRKEGNEMKQVYYFFFKGKMIDEVHIEEIFVLDV